MGWEERGESLSGLRLVSHHRGFSYLADWLDLDIVATLELKPGIPPSAAHLARVPVLRLVSHHRGFSYLADWLDLDIVATLELKPGIPPSAAHLASLLEQLSPHPPAAVVRTPYANERPSLWLTEHLDVRVLRLPYTVNEGDSPADLFALFDMTLTALEEVKNERL